ncbi:MAG TPA: nuclear transport factor 2 family protein [Thermoanaerobaculia bacterium]|nr:nuclear transport factor 2 family protein [Thermoanaerobaculia bacterium]
MKTAAQSLLWMALTASLVRADGVAEREIRALEAARTEAIHAGDMATLERLYADDFRGVTSAGQVVDKTRILEVLKSTDRSLTAEIDDLDVRIFDRTALATGLIRLTAVSEKGKALINSFRYTHIYVQREDRWQFIAGQSTNIPR